MIKNKFTPKTVIILKLLPNRHCHVMHKTEDFSI